MRTDEEESKLLSRFVTNTKDDIFVLRNLPEVIKGALFSRYSRSVLGLRELLLKEFINDESRESQFDLIAAEGGSGEGSSQLAAIKKAQSFYDRILDGYGDDSIGELGGAHLAAENISMLAAKAIEDRRIGGSPLEKSTRYIYFDQKVGGEYLFYREPILTASNRDTLYLATCNHLFDTYTALKVRLTKKIEENHPLTGDMIEGAYKAAVRAKVCDALRGLLPASALTNVGVFGNGRFYEYLIRNLTIHPLFEMREIGRKSMEELSKVIPSFVRRADPSHHNQESFSKFHEAMGSEIKQQVAKHEAILAEMSADKEGNGPGAHLIDCDRDAPARVAAAMLFADSNCSLAELLEYCKQLPDLELDSILEAGCSAREGRRHKSPRALEHAEFTFEILADFGCYRDLQRHRIMTQERQLLSCDHGYYIPHELSDPEMRAEYCAALDKAKEAYDQLVSDLPELRAEAQYIVPMAYNIRWYFRVNLRALQWMCELRSTPQGHSTYRLIAQEMAKQVVDRFPVFKRFFKFVDFDGYELGRLNQETKSHARAREKQGAGR